jgi:hypothetical protein
VGIHHPQARARGGFTSAPDPNALLPRPGMAMPLLNEPCPYKSLHEGTLCLRRSNSFRECGIDQPDFGGTAFAVPDCKALFRDSDGFIALPANRNIHYTAGLRKHTPQFYWRLAGPLTSCLRGIASFTIAFDRGL